MKETARLAVFPPFRFDLRTGYLWRESTRIPLHPQPAKVLALLIRRAGEVVSREEIQKEVWGEETFVDFDLGINSCIRQIRSALNDDAEHPRYVQTVPRRGYEFVAELAEPSEPEPRSGSPDRRLTGRRAAMAATAAAALAAWAFVGYRGAGRLDREVGALVTRRCASRTCPDRRRTLAYRRTASGPSSPAALRTTGTSISRAWEVKTRST